MYKQRPVELLDVMLSTKSFTSMVDQLDMLHRVGSSQSDMVDSIGTYQTTIRTAQKSLVTDRTAAQALVTQRATEKAGVQAALGQRQSMLRGVKAQIAALTAQQAQAALHVAQSAGVVAPPSGPISTNDTNVVTFAESFVGKVPYVYGGSTPAGFDCSGFTMYVYSHFGVGLPHNAAAQQSGTQSVPIGQEQPGDLVFFGSPAYHVGIYVGGGSMVNAPHTGAMVSYGSVAGASGFGRP
jgi:cell wall-associated NlpC family hydrolase